jgi:dTDP-4-dehydrorhamnose reductase
MKGQRKFASVKIWIGEKSYNMPQNKTRVLILGAQGRLGGSLQACWSESHIVTGLARPALDVSDLKALENLLADLEFDVLVNATGLTNVDRCESAREEANLVNTLAPAVMAECASQQGARLIHFSTDYVFNGEKHEPYTEDDIPSPLGWYGATKLEGERLVQASDPLHMVVRVSWVFGPAKPSFVDSLIQRALHDVRVEAIDDKFSSPTSATDAAQWLEVFFDPSMPGGLYHACNSGQCSWREYGMKALEYGAAAGLIFQTTRVEPIRLADMKQFIAPRPVYSILSTTKLSEATGHTPRHWQEALRDYILKKYAPISSPS